MKNKVLKCQSTEQTAAHYGSVGRTSQAHVLVMCQY